MIHLLRPLAALVFSLLIVFAICGCTDDDTRQGTAQHASIEAEAHAQATRDAAETAAVDAAAASAKAAELAALAEKMPTADRIAAAADARVLAASTNAVSVALSAAADKADRRAREASTRAETERQRQDKAKSDASWLWWCRAIALGSLIAGALIGGLIGYAAQDPRTGLLVGGGIAGVGMLVLSFGQALPWLAWLSPAAGAVGLIVWAVKHRGLQVAHIDLGRARDALATGYARTAEVLGKVNPEIRRELDRISIAEQHAAGVLESNSHALDGVLVHPDTIPVLPPGTASA